MNLAVHRHDPTPRGWGNPQGVHDHPPVPEAALDALRRRTLDKTNQHDDPRWYSHDAGPWAAVTDLHRSGDHATATALARLVHWCEDQAAAGDAIWTIRETP